VAAGPRSLPFLTAAAAGVLAEDVGAGPRVRSRRGAAAARACRRRCRLCGADAAGAQGGDRAWAMALKVPRPRVRAWCWGAAYMALRQGVWT